MNSTPEILSSEQLLKIIQENEQRNAALLLQNATLLSQNELLKWELAQIKRMLYGAKSERLVPAELPGQLSLGMDVPFSAEPAQETITKVGAHDRHAKKAEPKAPFRNPLPAHLHREIIEIKPEGDLTGYKEISREITEVLEMIESKLYVKRYERIKYAKPQEEGVIIGYLPSRIIERGLLGEALLTQIILDKYVDHCPLYRQKMRFDREGITIADSTLGDVIRQISNALNPLFELHVKEVMTTTYLQADETPARVLDRSKKGKTHRGFYWVYRSPEKRLVLFDYRQGRGTEGPAEMLKNFSGLLQTDGYAVYDNFEKRQEIILAGCMAHARRYFDKAKDSDRERVMYVMNKMQVLYETERIIREEKKSPEEILALRKEKSLPVLIELEKWMKDQLVQVPPKSPLGQALGYSLARWEKLTRYIYYPQLEIDNNLIENAIRPSVIGRKNYLFAGSHDGAKRSAMFYSFFATCKENNINPREWLKDVITRIMDTKMSELHTLLPSNWNAERVEAWKPS